MVELIGEELGWAGVRVGFDCPWRREVEMGRRGTDFTGRCGN